MFHLAQHRAGLGVHAAVEHSVRCLGLDGGQDGHEVSGFVGGELLVHNLQAFLLGGLFEDFSNALAVSGTVINDGDFFQLELVSGVESQAGAQRVVIGDDAVSGFVAWLGQVGVGGRARHMRDAAVVVNLGCRNGGAGIEVTDHASDFGVAQFLCGSGALFWISSVVFCHDFEFDFLAGDHDVLGIEVFNGHANAVFVVFAVVGLCAGHRGNVADFDDLGLLSRGHASNQGQGGERGKFQFHVHSV